MVKYRAMSVLLGNALDAVVDSACGFDADLEDAKGRKM
jgi:hypothetical protein